MAGKSKRDWLSEGLKILSESGVNALKIELIATKLRVTKGSFYHHFKNFEEYKNRLLTFFEKQGTREIIKLSEMGKTPEEKLYNLAEAALSYPPPAEVAIRSWSLQDESVRSYQYRIDKQRMAYLRSICIALLDDEKEGVIMAEMLHTIYIGCQQIIPPIEGQAQEILFRKCLLLYKTANISQKSAGIKKD